MRDASIAELRSMLKNRDDLVLSGRTRRDIERDVETGGLLRLRRDHYVGREEWEALWPEARHRAHVMTVEQDAGGPAPVFALFSAAVLHGLPLHRFPVGRVHTVVADVGRRSTASVARHVMAIADDEIVEVDGHLCTSPERTAYDLARLATPECALVYADALLGRIGGDPRRYDAHAATEWLSRMRRRTAVGGARGIRFARAVFELADGRSQLPLESVTKLQLHRLGFRELELQVRVPRATSGAYWVDIAIRDAGVLYECDGETKYTDAALRSGRTLERVLLEEKQREDWIRGATGMRLLRGGSADAATPQALAARLTAFGVAIPPRRDCLILPSRPSLAGP